MQDQDKVMPDWEFPPSMTLASAPLDWLHVVCYITENLIIFLKRSKEISYQIIKLNHLENFWSYYKLKRLVYDSSILVCE